VYFYEQEWNRATWHGDSSVREVEAAGGNRIADPKVGEKNGSRSSIV
jgi:hypothetical protein